MAHLRPEMCPIGAFSFYHHYIHDVKDITKALEIDWSLNSSWRQVCCFFFCQSVEWSELKIRFELYMGLNNPC